MRTLMNRHNAYLSTYFTLKEILEKRGFDADPYYVTNLKNIAQYLNINTQSYPVTLDGADVVRLWKELYARMIDHPIIRVDSDLEDPIPEDVSEDTFKNWFVKLLSLLSRTYDYYSTLLTTYTNEKTHLMDSVKATSKNKSSFNDTPQNDNSTDEYEGDDFITNFTKASGESTTEMNPKIIRIKEIQENFKRVLSDWVDEFERLWFEEVE